MPTDDYVERDPYEMAVFAGKTRDFCNRMRQQISDLQLCISLAHNVLRDSTSQSLSKQIAAQLETMANSLSPLEELADQMDSSAHILKLALHNARS